VKRCENVKLMVQPMTHTRTVKTTARNLRVSNMFLYMTRIEDLMSPRPTMEIIFSANFV
jgi:hypothetical protein